MPKSDTPASRRSARVASRGSAPDSVKETTVIKETKVVKVVASKKAVPKEKVSKETAKDVKGDEKSEAEDKKKAASKAAKPVSKPVSTAGGLKEGQKLPKITLQDNEGNDVDVSTLAGDKGVVIFLYPKADTPGCTNQACGFRDIHDDIGALGYEVFGLSKDLPSAQQKWHTKKTLNYKLLSDPESKLIKKLGAFIEPKNTKRSHFIFEKGSGKLINIALGVKPAEDPHNVLKFLKAHHA